MGLGTKIRGALSGDKGHHRTPSQQPRITPGAYPDSVVDVPRSASTKTRTWETTADTTPKRQPSSATKNNHLKAENDGPGEYTHLPANVDSAAHQNSMIDMESSQNEDEELLIPSPDSRTVPGSNQNHPALSKDSSNLQQHPYWGNIGKTDARKEDVGTNGHHLGRNGTINNGNYSTRRDQAGALGYDDDEKFGAPIVATVNRGQPQLTDEEIRATSMAASQISQPTQFDEDNGTVDLAYRTAARHNGNTGYGMDYPASSTVDHYDENYGVKRTPTVNGRGPSPTNARGTFGPPTWELSNNAHRDAYEPGTKSTQQHIKEREQGGSVGSNSDGISAGPTPRSAGVDHYGPGHSGAKVLHRCEHCGNDNDITKYFNRDVVYRLS